MRQQINNMTMPEKVFYMPEDPKDEAAFRAARKIRWILAVREHADTKMVRIEHDGTNHTITRENVFYAGSAIIALLGSEFGDRIQPPVDDELIVCLRARQSSRIVIE